MVMKSTVGQELRAIYDAHESMVIRDKAGVRVMRDQLPMTVPHDVMDRALDILDPTGRGGEWAGLRHMRAEAGGTVSREYPGLVVFAVFTALAAALKEG